MDDEMGPDLLSDLPSSIIETILTLVPIRDAIKTSVLSTKWRYRWTSIPHLFFTDECVAWDDIEKEESLKKFITFTLLLHKGPITTFSICSWILKHCAEVDQWILFLSRNNLRELVLEFDVEEWLTVPSCLFSCKNLIHLNLCSSYLKLPPSFKGFLCLRTLDLQPVLMTPDVERLISSCPLLENLKLYGRCSDLTIYAPNLKYLYLGYLSGGLRIQNSPLLKVMYITLAMDDFDDSDAEEDFEKSSACNFFEVLGNVPNLERLIGWRDFTQYLSIGLDLWKPHVTFNQLKVINLDVSFKDLKEIMVVLKLIINSPFLQDLFIRGLPITTNDVDSPDDEVKLLEIEYPSCTFKLLKNVKMSNMCAMPLEIKLIKYLLENSPTLEKMSITPCSNLNDTRFNMPSKLASFHRASSLVEVSFFQGLKAINIFD